MGDKRERGNEDDCRKDTTRGVGGGGMKHRWVGCFEIGRGKDDRRQREP